MEDQDQGIRTDEEQDVEAHKRIKGTDEPKAEGDSDDDFELHGGGGKKTY